MTPRGGAEPAGDGNVVSIGARAQTRSSGYDEPSATELIDGLVAKADLSDRLALELEVLAAEYEAIWAGVVTSTPLPPVAEARLRAARAVLDEYRAAQRAR